MGTLDEFREQFWVVLRRPRTNTKLFGEVRDKLELVSDALAGPLHSIYTNGECDYVFADSERFPGVRDPDSFLKWCLSLAEQYKQGASTVPPTNDEERLDQSRLLQTAAGMERLSRLACEVLEERRRTPRS